ncbi:hypothetical protein PAXINDRAFT_178109 [Paxillus involutus ATCC 200175]|nr:hypothetical protein PAXINDRAFT_178109 [Paxillus involutus ATCC 200175]
MLHHASRLLAPVTLPLSSILQAAAARAWTRRAHTNRTRTISKKKSSTIPDLPHNAVASSQHSHPALGKLKINAPNHAPVRVRPIDPDALADDDITWRDPGRVEGVHLSDPPRNTQTLIASSPAETLPIPPIPTPNSPESLYQNLLRITSNRPFSLSAVIDYHFDCPRRVRSTRSFNLLINLALRTTAFGTARRLFSAMRAEVIPANMETWKLTVRWLVRTGRWGEAWKRVLSITERKELKYVSMTTPTQPLPLPLWLELFGSQKRGALRRHNTIHATGTGDATENTVAFPTSLVPCSSQGSSAVEQSQYRALMQVSPPLTSSNCDQLSPRTILVITRTMFQIGRRDLALSTTLSYLESLPPRLRRSDRRVILDLVHLHLYMGTRGGKPGLKRHFAQRRTLLKLLNARRDLTPSPMTLVLLLSSLRACRRSGSLGMQCLRLFQKRWGPHVQSSLVRRRITSLALKEGRLDIAEVNIRAEKNTRCSQVGWRLQREVLGGPLPRAFSTLMRKPWRRSFSGRGAENRRWYLLEKKLEQMRHRACSNRQLP